MSLYDKLTSSQKFFKHREKVLAVEKQQAERLAVSITSKKTQIEVTLVIEVEDAKVIEFIAAHQEFLDMWGRSQSITQIASPE
jgi:septum formation inhibitor MinC